MHKASIKILSVAALNSTLTTSTLIIFHFPYQKTVRLILFNLCGFEFNLFCNSLVTYELLRMSTYLLKPFSEETLTAKTVCSKYYFHLLQRQSLLDYYFNVGFDFHFLDCFGFRYCLDYHS